MTLAVATGLLAACGGGGSDFDAAAARKAIRDEFGASADAAMVEQAVALARDTCELPDDVFAYNIVERVFGDADPGLLGAVVAGCGERVDQVIAEYDGD